MKTGIEFPPQMPPSVRSCILAASFLANETGQVEGGISAIAAILGQTTSSARRAVAAAEAFGFLVRRSVYLSRQGRKRGGPMRLFIVHRSLLSGDRQCENCRAPAPFGRHCPKCKQTFRRDRAWQTHAIEMAVRQIAESGQSKPASIAVAVGRPLFMADDPVDDGGGVVPLLLKLGLASREWYAALLERAGPDRGPQLVREAGSAFTGGGAPRQVPGSNDGSKADRGRKMGDRQA